MFQAPGFVRSQLEILETRIIPIGTVATGPRRCVAGWATAAATGKANTLVIDTTNIVAGDSATGDAIEAARGSPV